MRDMFFLFHLSKFVPQFSGAHNVKDQNREANAYDVDKKGRSIFFRGSLNVNAIFTLVELLGTQGIQLLLKPNFVAFLE